MACGCLIGTLSIPLAWGAYLGFASGNYVLATLLSLGCLGLLVVGLVVGLVRTAEKTALAGIELAIKHRHELAKFHDESGELIAGVVLTTAVGVAQVAQLAAAEISGLVGDAAQWWDSLSEDERLSLLAEIRDASEVAEYVSAVYEGRIHNS